jgi:hypothetical protein
MSRAIFAYSAACSTVIALSSFMDFGFFAGTGALALESMRVIGFLLSDKDALASPF